MLRAPRVSVWRRLLRSKMTVVLGGFVLLFVLVSFGRELLRRFEVNNNIERLQDEVRELEARKTNLTNLIQYFESPLFQEQEGREKLGLAKPGETVVVVPLTNAAPQIAGGTTNETTAQLPNPNRWWNYFFGATKNP